MWSSFKLLVSPSHELLRREPRGYNFIMFPVCGTLMRNLAFSGQSVPVVHETTYGRSKRILNFVLASQGYCTRGAER